MIETIMNSTFVLFSVYLLGSASGLFAERTGTINLSINGGMIIGALMYFLAAKGVISTDEMPIMWKMNIGALLLGILSGMVGSVIITSLLSVGAINLRGDQIVLGTAINIIAPVISLIIVISSFEPGGQISASSLIYGVQASDLGQSSPLTFWQISLMLAIFVSLFVAGLWFFLNKTRIGLRMKSAGENPHALAAAGVSVYKIRHLGMLISGMLSGLAGAIMAAFSPTLTTYSNNVSGSGFIALAVLIIGQWRLPFVALASFAISLIFSFVNYYAGNLAGYKWIISMLPYLGTVAILPFVSKFSRAPKAEGIPYVNAGR